ncbi:uncharacterized protein ARMOST_16735 [Armillaria ostoyae]|uniref:Uncharacterized protein n=1 Tax=Armillaria ostoyae TaxID=47428 RepID=A0A284RX32_ARMOS|nr:uncharacterized protein ARMOST_16735 [Armillaria ostoyae]
MGGIRNLTLNMYNICSDDDSDMEVFIEAARSSYNGIECHVLMYWDNNTLNQACIPYVQPAPAVAGLFSHAFNPNAFLGQLPQPNATAFIGSNTTGRQKASILCMTLGDHQAPICHIIIYPFRAYTLPELYIYNLEETD